MSKMKSLRERAQEYAREHRKAFENWTHGDIEKAWPDEGNEKILCIRYEDGQYWHYEETPDGLKWW